MAEAVKMWRGKTSGGGGLEYRHELVECPADGAGTNRLSILFAEGEHGAVRHNRSESDFLALYKSCDLGGHLWTEGYETVLSELCLANDQDRASKSMSLRHRRDT